MKRNRFHSSVKEWAVADYTNGNKTVAQIAKETGASRPAVYQWLVQAKQPSRGTLLERVAALESQVAALSIGKRL